AHDNAADAHPAGGPGGCAQDQLVVSHGGGDDRARTDPRVTTDGGPADDGCVRAGGRAAVYDGWDDLPIADGARSAIVGEHRARADEHLIADRDSRVHRDVVLDLRPVADGHVRVDEDVLAERAVPT